MDRFSAAISIITIVLIIVIGVSQSKTKNFCLERGYPSYTINYKLQGYCIKRVDQTDSVVAVRDLR